MAEMERGEFVAYNITQQLGTLGVIILPVCGGLGRDTRGADKGEENKDDDMSFQEREHGIFLGSNIVQQLLHHSGGTGPGCMYVGG